MNVASLELCKDLFKLSGWDDTEHSHELYIAEQDISGTIPAYDLGYLLRKLPDEATSKKHGGYHYFYMHHNSEYWYAYYGVIDTTEFMEYANTPEDAACKLAIELFRQGVLEKAS